jgi:integrase
MTKRPRIHDLRHSHASWLIAGGMDIAGRLARLGHETTSLTVGHLLPPDAEDALDDALAILEVAMPVSPPGPAAPGA